MWGLRGVRQKGGKKQDIPLPAAVVRFLRVYVDRVLAPECEGLTPDTPLFWSSWGKRTVGRTRAPMTPKNIWRLCKTYGKLIGYPELKPHDLPEPRPPRHAPPRPDRVAIVSRNTNEVERKLQDSERVPLLENPIRASFHLRQVLGSRPFQVRLKVPARRGII